MDSTNKCAACGLWANTALKRPSEARGSDTPSILIIGDAPAEQEDSQGVFFRGQHAELLESYIASVGIPFSEIRYESVVRCMPKKPGTKAARSVTKEDIEFCQDNLFCEIARLQPKLLFTLGNTALNTFTGRNAITQARGRTYQWELPSHIQTGEGQNRLFTVLPSINPAAVLRGNQEFEACILADLAMANELLFGSNRIEDYRFLETLDEIKHVLDTLKASVADGSCKYVALDTETIGLDPWTKEAKLICVSLCAKEGTGYVIPYQYSKGPFADDLLARKAVSGMLKDFLSSVPVVGHNIKFDIKWLLKHANVKTKHVAFDTMLAAWALYSDTIPHDLEYLASVHVGVHASKQEMHEALARLPKETRNMDNVDKGILTRYACRDADNTFRLSGLYMQQLEDQELTESYNTLSLDMIKPFADIEFEGAAFTAVPLETSKKEYEDKEKQVPILLKKFGFDIQFNIVKQKLEFVRAVGKLAKASYTKVSKVPTLASEAKELHKIVTYVEKCRKCISVSKNPDRYDYVDNLEEVVDHVTKLINAHNISTAFRDKLLSEYLKIKATKYELSISSTADMGLLLYDVFNLPIYSVTDTHSASTAKEAIVNLLINIEDWISSEPRWIPVKEFLLFYQDLKKGQKLYSTYILKLPDYADVDSRLHTSYNIGQTATGRFSSSDPSLHTLPKKSTVKCAFVSRFENGIITSCDLSQAEMRILAIFSKDQALLDVFRRGGDIHIENASRLFKKTLEDVTKDERNRVKAVSFGIVYGQGAEGLSAKQHISKKEAQKLIDMFYNEFPLIKRWMDEQTAFVRKHKCTYTAFGHRRLIPESNSDNLGELGKADRIAVNSPIQGTASQLTSTAIVRIYNRMTRAKMKSKIFGFVHDEIAVDTHPNEAFQVFSIMRKELGETPQRLYKWLSIPVAHSFECGVSWGDKVDIEPTFTEPYSFTAKGSPQRIDALTECMSKWDKPMVIESKVEEAGDEGKTIYKVVYRSTT